MMSRCVVRYRYQSVLGIAIITPVVSWYLISFIAMDGIVLTLTVDAGIEEAANEVVHDQCALVETQ